MINNFGIDEFVKKCKKHRKIYCYGAGEYGKLIFAFLKLINVKVEKFIVSYDDERIYCGVPVVRISSMKKTDFDDSLVILSLGEVYHSDVEKLIGEIATETETYPVTQAMIDSLPIDTQKYVIINEICDGGKYSDSDIPAFERKLKNILRNHNRIKLTNMYATQIGVMLLSWMYYNEAVRYTNDFVILFPFTRGRQINNYLMKKMNNDNVEVIVSDQYGFWKYVFENHTDVVDAEFEFNQTNPDDYHKFFKKINITLSERYDNKLRTISFNENEIGEGETFLNEHNLGKYVCIFARDSRYTKEVLGYDNKNFDVIDFYREIPVDCFDYVASYLHNKGISTVRMGSLPGMKSCSKYIFDYGSNYRTEFLDIFLFSKCMFFLGTPSGIQYFADLFSKPMVMINVPVLSTEGDGPFVHRTDSLMIIQKYWDKKKNRYLTIKDMLKYESTGDKKKDPNAPGRTLIYYSNNDIVPVKNTSEEILGVAEEMIDILAGKAQYDDLDQALYEKYEEILLDFAGKGNTVFPYRLGRKFLRENQWLLE